MKICDLVNAALGKLSNLWKTFVLTGLKKYEKPCIARDAVLFGFPQAAGEKVEKSPVDTCQKSSETLKFSSGEKLWIKRVQQLMRGLHKAFWAVQK
ncbi:MAG: hypothetical protein IKG76_00655 [Firmicutes bacterium]|nr:hypothetical protein [Bacillota bacterium]